MYRCPDCGGEVDLARTPLESGLVRLAVLGAEDFALEFGDEDLRRALRTALGPCPHAADPAWDVPRLEPLARTGLAHLERAAAGEARMAELLAVWRPRA